MVTNQSSFQEICAITEMICDQDHAPKKTVLNRWGIFVAIAKQYIVWVKIIDFTCMSKVIKILSKDHVAWRYIVHFLP